ncbi:hypothetical protein C8A05DRAFT_12800 [Staphylotrichum tortipilum]|uniref:Uncharacterized protein n=1 Tax=Staphylotrichum tortipilum TaxID=2831512 RepID=A0AAN6MSW8_9PEZI|nr:hypothetical protein C8A05DRAFT_12800 [Staphylotrichum longicolle]
MDPVESGVRLSGAAAATNCRYYRTSSNFFGHLGIISTIGAECVPTVIGPPLLHMSTIAGTPEEAACPPPWLGNGRRGTVVWTHGIGTEPLHRPPSAHPRRIEPPGKSSPIQPQTPNMPICPLLSAVTPPPQPLPPSLAVGHMGD